MQRGFPGTGNRKLSTPRVPISGLGSGAQVAVGRYASQSSGELDSPHDGSGEGFRRRHTDGIQVGPPATRREDKNDVAVKLRMDGPHGAGHAVMRHLSHLGGLELRKAGIRQDDSQRRVGPSKIPAGSACKHLAASVDKSPRSRAAACPGQNSTRAGVHDVAETVYHSQRLNPDSTREAKRGEPLASLRSAADSEQFPNGRARSRPYASLPDAARSLSAGFQGHRGGGPGGGGAEVQIKDNG